MSLSWQSYIKLIGIDWKNNTETTIIQYKAYFVLLLFTTANFSWTIIINIHFNLGTEFL